MTDDEVRTFLLDVLERLEAAEPPTARRLPDDVSLRVPVIKGGEVIGYVEEKYVDRGERWHHHLRQVHELRQALEDGADPYRIAWLAMTVGGGTHLPTIIAAENKSDAGAAGGRKSRRTPPDAEVYAAVEEKFITWPRLANKQAYRSVAKDMTVSYKAVEQAHKRACDALGIPHLRRKRRTSE